MNLPKLDYSFVYYMHKKMEMKLREYNRVYTHIENKKSLLKIYNLWYFNIIYEPSNFDGLEYFHLSTYYRDYVKNSIQSKILYSKALELRNWNVLNNIAIMYLHINQIVHEKNCNRALELLNEIGDFELVNYNIGLLYYRGCIHCGIEKDVEKAILYLDKCPEDINANKLLTMHYLNENKTIKVGEIINNLLMNSIYIPEIYNYVKMSINNQHILARIKYIEEKEDMINKHTYSEEQFSTECDIELNNLRYKDDFDSQINLGLIYCNLKENYDLGLKHVINAYDINPYYELEQKIIGLVIEYSDNITWKPYLNKFWNKNEDDLIETLLLITKYKNQSKYEYLNVLNKGITFIIIDYLMHVHEIDSN